MLWVIPASIILFFVWFRVLQYNNTLLFKTKRNAVDIKHTQLEKIKTMTSDGI